jgi:undecaprenyl-diphosphatase
MTAGRLMGLTRETSARFSFLLSTPIIAGAGVKELTKLAPGDIDSVFITGVLVSALVGFLAIKFLLRYLSRRNYSIFAWYRLLAGLLVIGVYFYRNW